MKEVIKFLLDIISLPYFEKIQQSKYLRDVNNTVDIWCDKVKQSPKLLGRSIALMMLSLCFLAGLMLKVTIWQSLSFDLLRYIIMPLFIAALIVNYHANSTETTKEFVIRKLQKTVFPVIYCISCLLIYIKTHEVLPYEEGVIVKMILLLIMTALFCFIALPVFDIIAYFVSKKINKPIIEYVKRELSSKFMWNCLRKGIGALILYTTYNGIIVVVKHVINM